MYSEHVGWKRHRCGVTSDTVLWYHRMTVINVGASCAEKTRSPEELLQLPLNVPVMCNLYARPRNHHQVPSRRQRTNANNVPDTALRAISHNGATDLPSYHKPQTTVAESIRADPQRNTGAIIRPAPTKHRSKLLTRGQRPLSAHTRATQA